MILRVAFVGWLFGGRILCLVIISSRETHVPIPNTLVKPLAANGSAVYCGVRVGRRQAFFVFYTISLLRSLAFKNLENIHLTPIRSVRLG